ncbi:MAG: UDP-N-acetylmuramoyl-tripeptide--D-alanyl-D-alanine ligase [Cyanothece sp. SIO1E1]|nr:UDP-N-acetylmuramoyl-tripeptide--D-alanyl-D-alanine ligase [Cyanothece sp. SIO1E1]
MSCSATLKQLIDILAATPLNLSDSEMFQMATGIATDSRQIQPGDVFLALTGEKFDGHQFVAAAHAQGAIAAIVHRGADVGTIPSLQVDDTLKAYQAIAHWWRQQFSVPLIAVTGSVGKTTTKELIAAVLSAHGRVLKSQANYNNEIGVPKTLLELGSEHDYAVLEMGMRGPGEIAWLTQIAQPNIGVITNVGTAHIGRLGSEQAIANAKCELLAHMPADGVAILNHDNARLMQTAATVWSGQTVTYGLEAGDVQGEILAADTLRLADKKLPLPLPGAHNALNYLAALAVAKTLHLAWLPEQHFQVNLPAGRAQRYALPNDVLILDETYNAGLESMLAALKLLAQTPGKRHIAVLGTMKELGEHSIELHRQVGAAAQQLKLDALLVLADEAESKALAAGAGPILTTCFHEHEAVVDHLKKLVQAGDRLLFKASRAVGLDQVVKQFCAVQAGSNA